MWGTSDVAYHAVFVMLNPSTADAAQDDPTIRRCVGYASVWGRTGIIVANLYALRRTDPAELWKHSDPVGPLNDEYLAELVQQYGDIICAWGVNARADRVAAFRDLVEANGGRTFCLGVTKDGHPRHPLYLKRDARPVQWPLSSGDKIG